MSYSPTALDIRGLSHSFGPETVLRDVTLSVMAAEVHCLLGPSGSGKSTLLRLVAGLEELQQGAISIAGNRVAGDGVQGRGGTPPEARPVGFVFQDYALFPHLNVLRNVTFGMRRPGRGTVDDRDARALDLLARVDMTAYAKAMPHTLSGGQQQRVALARALARRPAVMLLDEPFSGLDGRLRAEVRQRTLEVLRALEVATVIVTHDPQEALLAGDRISVLDAGTLLQTGSPEEIYHRSASVRVAEVFGPVNHFECVVERGTVQLPWGATEVPDVADGVKVEVLVRADDVVLTANDEEAAAHGVVTKSEWSQGAKVVYVDCGQGRDVRALELVRNEWGIGERVGLYANKEAAIVFLA